MRNKRYLIVEQGQYSDYGVSIVEVPMPCVLTDDEILLLLKIDQYDSPQISGEFFGRIVLFDNSSISTKKILEKAEHDLNSLFSCFENRKHKTCIDRLYTKEELLTITTENDKSSIEFWKKEIENRYPQYVEGYQLYTKLKLKESTP